MSMDSTTAMHLRDDAGSDPAQRLAVIGASRRAVMVEGASHAALQPWIDRSWRRCLSAGRRPEQPVAFDVLSASASRRALEAGQPLIAAATPVLHGLARAMESTRYFAILTDANGVVVAVDGPIDHGDRRAQLITRIGVDLSEASVGTTAIGAALNELTPVWLHRGEHFFDDTSVYSCAGAPIFDGAGRCAGMLDLTGVETRERPELRHLVAQSACAIGDALVRAAPHALCLRLTWPGLAASSDAAGLVCVDRDGWLTGCNLAARQMLGLAPTSSVDRVATPAHCNDIFAQRWESLFSLSPEATGCDIALWSGLTLHARAITNASPARSTLAAAQRRAMAAGATGGAPLRDVEIALIHRAVQAARGNVEAAARALGISRATVYRKLRQKPSERN